MEFKSVSGIRLGEYLARTFVAALQCHVYRPFSKPALI